MTSQGLVPQDTDGVDDVYDARLGGGFPPPPAPAEACAGDACQGPLTNPAPLLVPGSVSQAPGGNFAAPVPATATTPKAKPATCKKGFVKKKGKCVKRPKATEKQTKKSITPTGGLSKMTIQAPSPPRPAKSSAVEAPRSRRCWLR